MKQTLFEDYPLEQRRQMLEDNADEITRGKYSRKFDDIERNQRRARVCDIEIELTAIDKEMKAYKEEIKSRRQPLLDEKLNLINEIKANGEYVEGNLYKMVDREAKEVGIYDQEGNLVEQRRMTSADRQVAMKFKTGTND